MEQLPNFITNKFGKYIDMNAKARERRSSGIRYQDDQRYNDHQGALWLNVKHKDFNTIAAAVLTGMADTHKIPDSAMQYFDRIVSSEELTKEFLEENQRAKSLVNSVWAFLKQYMSKGTVTVYRGLEVTDELENLIKSDPHLLYSPAKLIQYVDNTTKEFNSFSTNIEVAKGFAHESQRRYSRGHVVFSAEVDNNDVNWAFTAYLMGRHGTTSEQELNINNLKRLKNVKIISYKIGYTDTRRVLKMVTEPIKQVFKRTNGLFALKQLCDMFKNNPVRFNRWRKDGDGLITNGNWNILYLTYNFNSQSDVDDTSLVLAYNTKSQQLLCGENMYFHRNSLFAITGNSRTGSLYCGDSARPVLSFTCFKFIDENPYSRDTSSLVAFKLQNNMWRLFDCETCEFTNDREYADVIMPYEFETPEGYDVISTNNIDVHLPDAVLCVNDKKIIEAVYSKKDNYTQTIPDTVLHSDSRIYDTCTVKGKQAFFVERHYEMNLYGAKAKIVDENNTVLVDRVKSVYNNTFAVVATENSKKHACKLLNLNTMHFVSDVEFYDLYPMSSKLKQLMNKFIIITRITDDDKDLFNILLNTGGEEYSLGLTDWAVSVRDFSDRYGQTPCIVFTMSDNEKITYDISSGTLNKGNS